MYEEKSYTVKELPDSLKPYEKFEALGPGSLSDAELLAVIIRSGTVNVRSIDLCENILCHNNGSGLSNLHSMTINELSQIKGIGRVKSIQLKCIAELAKRMAKHNRSFGVSFSDPESIAAYYMEDMRNFDRENIMLVLLDTKSRKIHDMIISTGSVNSSIASTRDIFYQALKYGAVSIILLHNHPSGDPIPSREDYNVTDKVKAAGDLIGISLLDHIIIGDNCFFSMRAEGRL
ncbi:MAG: JAB domain-containing protein [Lachnospiraceae bacterium]|nr:JAB domain-containing protein [Lachnospiraceae bacterium]